MGFEYFNLAQFPPFQAQYSKMEGPPLRLPTPFGKGMISVAGHLRRALLKQHITPTQTDGEMLLAMCYAQKDDLPAWVDTFSHLMLGDDLCSWVTQEVGWTEDFRWICNLALEEVTPPIEDEDREATSNALAFLLKEVTRGAPTMRYTASDLRRSQEDRDNWSLFYQQPPSLPPPVARWRHWKPRQLQETDPITQRQLEKELRLKWAQRLICLLAPFADKIPNMASVMGKDQEREWIDLLGDTRFRTLRIHCLALENLQAQGFIQVPWTEADVRDHLNRMRAEEASPHKIQRVWETLRWFSKRFGFLKIDACERLMEKKKTLQEEGVDTVARPQRKAILPTKEVIWTLEEVAAGPGPTPAQSGEGPSPVELLDQYICGVVRFQVACSARFNDLQHTIPTAYVTSSMVAPLNSKRGRRRQSQPSDPRRVRYPC